MQKREMFGGEDAVEEIARDRDLGANTRLSAILAISCRTTKVGSLDRELSQFGATQKFVAVQRVRQLLGVEPTRVRPCRVGRD